MGTSFDVVRDFRERADRWDAAADEDERKAQALSDQGYEDIAVGFAQSAVVHRRIAIRERELANRIAITT